jgi:hypothetical protein
MVEVWLLDGSWKQEHGAFEWLLVVEKQNLSYALAAAPRRFALPSAGGCRLELVGLSRVSGIDRIRREG